MHFPSEQDPPSQKVSPARQKFVQRISALPIKPNARLLWHASVLTNMIYLHIIRRPAAGAPSPLGVD